MKTYTLFTHAGGAGKTSLARDLGFELASRGYRVLLVDADPQANLTAWLGVEADRGRTLLHLVRSGELPEPVEVRPRYHLIPADISLALAEIELAQKPLGEVLLRGGLSALEGRYDFVFVDSLPSLGKLAVMAALAGDGLILPVEATPKGLQAAATVLALAEEYLASLKRLDPKARSLRRFTVLVVPTKFDPRTSTGRLALEALAQVAAGLPASPPLSLRPGVYGRATDGRVPVHEVGSEEAVQEVRAVAEVFLRAVGAEEVVRG